MSTFNPLTGTSNPFDGLFAGRTNTPSLGDIDGDGDLDLVVGEGNGTLQYFRNTGTAIAPVYAAQTGTNNPFNGFDVDLASVPSLGDIDGDGDLDLVVGAESGKLNYYRNTGTAIAPVYVVQTGTHNPFNGLEVESYSSPSLGDIDGDGDLDVVLGAQNGFLYAYRNTGTATAPVYVAQTGTNNPFNGVDRIVGPSQPGLGDIDGDGDLDLVLNESYDVTSTYRNTGTATAPVYAKQTGTNNPFDGNLSLTVPSFGDIDRDGDLDLVSGDGFGKLLTFQNQAAVSAPVYARTVSTANPFGGIDIGLSSTPSLGDIDGDGDLDLVVGNGNGGFSYFRNTGTATAPAYAAQVGTANPFTGIDVGDFSSASLGDIDGDGDLDLVVGELDGVLNYYRNTGNATTPVYAQQTGANNPFNGVSVGLNSTPSLGDVDGDGDLDLVVGEFLGVLNYYRNTGNAIAPVYAEQSGTNNPFAGIDVGAFSVPSLGDVDGDGDLDLLIGEADGDLNYYRNNGTATAPVYVAQTGTGNPFNELFNEFFSVVESAPTLADIDRDGDLDVVFGENSGTLLTFIHQDAPTLRQAAFNLTGTNEDTDSTPVTVVSLLTSAGWADVDALALQGLAITGSTGAGWQYSVGGSTWTPVGAASATAAVLLSAGTQLRYAPDRANGETASLSFLAWDQTSGTASADGTASTADTTARGGGTALSTASSTASLVVTALNDVPVVGTSGGSTTYEESSSAVVVDSGVTVTDVDSAQLVGAVVSISSNFVPGQDSLQFINQLGITGSWNAGTGQLTLSGTASVASYQTALRSVAYLNNSDAPDTTTRVLTFTASDSLATSIAATRSVAVTAVNDAPVVSAAGLNLNEGQTVTLSAANFTVVDPDSTSFTFAVSGVAGGFFQLSTAAGAAVTGFSAAQLAGGLVQFVDDGNEAAPAFSITASDGALNSNTLAATIHYSPVNDAPTTTPVTLPPVNEDTPFTITQALLLANASDVDRPAQTLTVTNLQVSAGLGSVVNTSPGAWLFTPAPNDDTQVSFSYTIGDGSATVAGSAKLDLLPVNDPPVAVADSAQASAVGGAVNIAVLANDSDIDGGPLTVAAVTQGSGGGVAIRTDGVSVRYTPNAGFSGFDTFTYTASDGAGGTAVGTVRVLVPSYIGTAGNDVPLGTPQADFMQTGDGNDRVLSYDGADLVDGGRGADTLSGGLGADTLIGGDGADTFLTTAAELAGDSIDGGNQIDTLQITDPIAVMPAAFTLVNVEQLSFPGSLQVGHTSLLDLSALTLSGTGNQINGGTAASRITGTRSADRITDSAGNDDLRGGDGNDTIMAGVGQDTVHGGNGNDTLGGSSSTLGDGSVDTFVFNTALNALTNVDTVIGFEAGSRDVIALDSSIFSAIGPTLDASEFSSAIGGNAADANDFILFDPATGALYYDADGSGAVARIQFATLGAGLSGVVDASDFAVGSFPA